MIVAIDSWWMWCLFGIITVLVSCFFMVFFNGDGGNIGVGIGSVIWGLFELVVEQIPINKKV